MRRDRIFLVLRIFLVFILTFLLAACEKELAFHYHDVESQLVIEGNTSENGTTVSLTYTCPMDAAMDLTPVTDASVFLTDVTEGVSRELALDSNGTYMDDTPGIYGHVYRLDVSHKGNHYKAESTMCQPTRIIDLDFQWIKMPYDHVAVLRIEFTDIPSQDTFYWLRLYRNGKPYQWILSDDRASVNGVISEVTMTTRKNPDDEDDKDNLVDGDAIDVAINPISREMYDYLVAIQSDSNGPRMYDGNFCLGYYLASPKTTSSIVFRPNDMVEYK